MRKDVAEKMEDVGNLIPADVKLAGQVKIVPSVFLILAVFTVHVVKNHGPADANQVGPVSIAIQN